ncbi:beta strand repeat-containing protein [Cerasicoccus frondis]|uniref:beta strand repeat-containing protein n=1 Tax=Cerasicoccus frondis TaxID=490090 RepID=UPI002852BFB5|nr:hypothetical protein [Cerasicoccus frondis]
MFQLLNGISRQSQLPLIGFTLVSASLSLSGATVYWTDGSGNGNWSSGTNWSSSSIPTVEDDVYFNVVPTQTVGISYGYAAYAKNFYFGGSNGIYSLALDKFSSNAYFRTVNVAQIGYAKSADATITVQNDSSWDAAHIVIGLDSAEGQLDITGGGVYTSEYITLGSDAESSGIVTVTTSEAELEVGTNLSVGLRGYGELTVSDEANVDVDEYLRLGYYSTADGYVTVDGGYMYAGTSGWNTIVGLSGYGELTVENGGYFSATNTLIVGRNSGSTGLVIVRNGDALLEADNLTLGGNTSAAGGTGVLQVYSDSSVEIANDILVWPSGTLMPQGGTIEATDIYTLATGGGSIQGYGTVRVNGSWDIENVTDWTIDSKTSSGALAISYSGASIAHTAYDLTLGDAYGGALYLNDGTVFTTERVYMGAEGGSGEIGLYGDLTANTLVIDSLNVGDDANGGGSGKIDLHNGQHFATVGDMAASRTASSSNTLYVISSDESTAINVEASASFSVNGGLNIGGVSGLYGRVALGNNASLTMLDTNDDLTIGANGGTGLLDQSDTSTVTAGMVLLGAGSGGDGSWEAANGSILGVRIGDDASGYLAMEPEQSLTLTNGFSVGLDGGYGEMYLEDATFAAGGDSYLGDSGRANGDITVVRSDLSTTSDFYANANGSSTILIQDASSLSVGGRMELSNVTDAGTSLFIRSGSGGGSLATITEALYLGANSWLDLDGESRVIVGDDADYTTLPESYMLISAETDSHGEVDIEDALVILDAELYVGHSDGNIGNLALTGEDAELYTFNDVHIGEDGNAQVNIENSAIWHADGDNFEVGLTDGVAKLNLLTGGALNIAGDFYVGNGHGDVEFDMQSGSTLYVEGASYLGENGAEVTFTVDASTLTLLDDCFLGTGAEGYMYFTNGSVIDASSNITIGREEDSLGLISFDNTTDLDGLPGFWLASDHEKADGTLYVKGGSDITVRQLAIGEHGEGYASVSGAGSVLTIENSGSSLLRVGLETDSTGYLEVYDGGTLSYLDTTNGVAKIGLDGYAEFNLYGSGSNATFASSLLIGTNADSAGSLLQLSLGASLTGTSLEIRNNASATVTGSGSELKLTGSLALDGAGVNTFTLANSATASISDVIYVGNDDVFEMKNGTTLLAGGFDGDLSNVSGTFSPGVPVADVTVTGDYTQNYNGKLILEIGGETAGSEYDILRINGAATLDGDIEIQFINDYKPSGGETFRVLYYDSLIDNTYTLTLPSLDPGLEWSVDVQDDRLLLQVALTEDLAGFRQEYGLAADGSDDYADWSNNGIENFLYFAFGLGDPSNAVVDAADLPTFEMDSSGDITYRYVRLIDITEIAYTLRGSFDLMTWQDIGAVGSTLVPTTDTVETIDELYESRTLTFDVSEDTVFLELEVNEITPE